MTVLPSHLCINHRQTQLHAGCQGMDLECLACLPLHRLMIDPDDFAWSQKRQALSMEWRTPLFLAHPTALPGSFVCLTCCRSSAAWLQNLLHVGQPALWSRAWDREPCEGIAGNCSHRSWTGVWQKRAWSSKVGIY